MGMSDFLRPGERVRVYRTDENGNPEALTGEVDGYGNGSVRVICREAKLAIMAHPRQCKRLKKRERRRFVGKWQHLSLKGGIGVMAFVPDGSYTELAKHEGREMALIETKPKAKREGEK
jgi:hypothetical protein